MAKIRNLTFPQMARIFTDDDFLLKNFNRQFVIDYVKSVISAGISTSYQNL